MSDPTAPAPERTACCGDHCTATATHGPGAFPVACWQHAGDWPEIPAPPPSEAPPTTESARPVPPPVKPTAGEHDCETCDDRSCAVKGCPANPDNWPSADVLNRLTDEPVALTAPDPEALAKMAAGWTDEERARFVTAAPWLSAKALPAEAPAPSEPARPVPLSTADLDGLERSLDAGRTWEPDEATVWWVLGVLRRASEPAAPGGDRCPGCGHPLDKHDPVGGCKWGCAWGCCGGDPWAQRGAAPPEAPVGELSALLANLRRMADDSDLAPTERDTARDVADLLERLDSDRPKREPAAPGGEVACDYCCGVGACPRCWGRAAVSRLAADNARLSRIESDCDQSRASCPMTDHTSEDDESDIIIAGRQVPFVQVGMIVHPDDCLNCEREGSPLWCSALVCDIHDDDETARFGMMATLLFRNGERREEPCDELRRRWRLARDFDQGRVYTGRWGTIPRGSVWPVAEVNEDA